MAAIVDIDESRLKQNIERGVQDEEVAG